MSADTKARRYRFAALHRAGLFGAVPVTQLVTLALGVIGSWAAVLANGPSPVALLPVAAAGAVGFGRVGGQPLHDLGPRAVLWAARRGGRRHRWYRPVTLTGHSGPKGSALPAVLDGLDLFDVQDRPGGGPRAIGVVRDRRAGLLTAVVPVSGDGTFGLADPATQEARLDLWGLALAGFCREGSPVARVAWHDWTSPTGIGEHATDITQRWQHEPATPARDSYLRLIDAVAPVSVRHEVLVTVTVDLRRTGRRRRGLDGGLTALLEETRLFVGRLEHAGLTCAPALNAADLVTAMRVRSDPASLAKLAALRRSLAAAASTAAPQFGPMAVAEDWNGARVDGAAHRSWWVARWPRREVPAAWLDQLLYGLSCTRTVTVVFEPVAPSRSDREIDRESVTRATNASDKARRGFRVKASDRKAGREVELREAELNDGYGELAYAGVVTVTVTDPEQLDRVAATVEQTAAQAGIELAPLYGRQAAGWVASLPLGRTLNTRRRP